MKNYLLISLILLATYSVHAQNTTAATIASDTTEKERTSLSLATIYTNDVNYYGQTSGERLPYVLGNATLQLPSGFFLSAGAYKLLNYGEGVSGVDLGAGFDFKLSKNLRSSVSFTKSFFPDSSLFLQSANQNIASATLDYDWQWLNTGLSADYALGDQSALFLTFNASKLIDLGSVFSSKDYITIEPTFQIVGGTQRIITTEIAQPTNSPQNGNGGNQNGGGLGDLGGGLTKPITGSQRRVLPVERTKDNKPRERSVETSSFDMLSYNLKIPVAYNRANYAIEASYQGSILSNKVVGASQKPRSFLSLGFYYIF